MADNASEHVSFANWSAAFQRYMRGRPLWHSMSCICGDCLAADLVVGAYHSTLSLAQLQPREDQLATERAA